MKIYKLSYEQYLFDIDQYSSKIPFSMEDAVKEISEATTSIVNDYLNGATTIKWVPVDISRIKPLYAYFIKYHNVRDNMISHMHSIIIDLAKNIARLQATTELLGHAMQGLDAILYSIGLNEEEIKKIINEEEKFYNYIDSLDQTPISDYGLPKLWKILEKLLNEPHPNMQISLMSQLFDVIHQRNDLASFLVKGGSKSLWQLSNIDILK